MSAVTEIVLESSLHTGPDGIQYLGKHNARVCCTQGCEQRGAVYAWPRKSEVCGHAGVYDKGTRCSLFMFVCEWSTPCMAANVCKHMCVYLQACACMTCVAMCCFRSPILSRQHIPPSARRTIAPIAAKTRSLPGLLPLCYGTGSESVSNEARSHSCSCRAGQASSGGLAARSSAVLFKNACFPLLLADCHI